MNDRAAQAQATAREYLRTRGTLATTSVIRERVGAAFDAFQSFLASVPPALAGRCAIPGEWTIHEVVDHLLESNRPGLDELRCLLAGQSSPGEPIPAGLQSKAPLARPWPWLLRELARVDADIVETLVSVPDDFTNAARGAVVMVVNVPDAEGRPAPFHWVEALDWKAYAIVFRLHAIDHLNQAKKALAACRSR